MAVVREFCTAFLLVAHLSFLGRVFMDPPLPERILSSAEPLQIHLLSIRKTERARI